MIPFHTKLRACNTVAVIICLLIVIVGSASRSMRLWSCTMFRDAGGGGVDGRSQCCLHSLVGRSTARLGFALAEIIHLIYCTLLIEQAIHTHPWSRLFYDHGYQIYL